MPAGPRIRDDKFIKRLTSKFLVGDDCWTWQGTYTNRGYGVFWDSETKNNRFAHRVVFETFETTIPDDMNLCHKCDNPACVNPTHMFIGTQQDNMTDKTSKGRCGKPPSWGGLTCCPKGHARTPENIFWKTHANGRQYSECRICKRQRDRLAYLRKKDSIHA